MTKWTWAGASQCGTAHKDAGERRQDAFRVGSTASNFLVGVACDGAGSASHGGYGAAIASRVISNRAKAWIAVHGELPTPRMIELWVAEARLAIIVLADRVGCTASDFASTLVMAISNGTTTATAHIGDGGIVARCSTGAMVEISWPENGEYASTTFFITDPIPNLRIGMVKGIAIDRLAVFTDGLERLALDFAGQVAHRPFFETMFKAVTGRDTAGHDKRLSQKLSTFLDSDGINARTDDDKTLLLAAFE